MPHRISAALAATILLLSSIALAEGSNPTAEGGPTPPGSIEFVGKNLFATAKGVFHEWRVVESQIQLERPEEIFVVVEVDLKSVDTGIEMRDDHLRDPDFFETETYPTATARVHSLRPLAATNPDGTPSASAAFELSIDLDLHGVQKTVPGTARLLSREPLVFEGETTIDRTDFGIGPKPSRWNPATPRAEIPIRFKASF